MLSRLQVVTVMNKDIKSCPHILPWKGIMEVAKLMTMMLQCNGGKHPKDSWKDLPIDVHMDAAMRHYYEWYGGKSVDDESGLDPLVHMACRVLMALSNKLSMPTDDEIKFEVVGNYDDDDVEPRAQDPFGF